MAKKYRSAESYHGNTAEAKKNQRSNLIPGNIYRKRHVSELRLNCWWKCLPAPDIQSAYQAYENKRFGEDTPKKEWKSEKFLNEWWNNLDLENKKIIYKFIMNLFTKENKSKLYNEIQECLKVDLKGDTEGLKEG